MENIKNALENLNRSLSAKDQHSPISFDEFLQILTDRPSAIIRNIFQVFHDMIKNYVGEGYDEYPDDPESIDFVYYDCDRLFVENTDHPFFADRLFANRLIGHVEALRRGAQQNKLYIFKGPPGCGKSTFLNNLLLKFEEYANTKQGSRYEVVWRLDRKVLGLFAQEETGPFHPLLEALEPSGRLRQLLLEDHPPAATEVEGDSSFYKEGGFLHGYDDFVEVPCPGHDNPILMIPKQNRRAFFDDLIENGEFKWKLFTEKEYEWVFKETPCTICSSLYDALVHKLKNPLEVFQLIYAKPYHFNKRLGEGITVFSPGDKPTRHYILTNPMLQRRINLVLKDSNQVNYIFSQYAKTNNGIYALMDVKSHNTGRLLELHNIISEGVHKVDDVEENVNSLFIALMNPEDTKNIQDFQSFSDRIEYINIPYILDLNTEVEIYRNIFGRHIDENFLPMVLHNFARVIIATRLNIKSKALLDWIEDPDDYKLYCDENLQLLKMEIYTGHIPAWLSEEDRKRFTAKRRRDIIAESETEGSQGSSGRDSIKIFNEFYSTYAKDNKLIDMSMLSSFFAKMEKEQDVKIPKGFLDSLLCMYHYKVLQQVKEALYDYNEEQIGRDIQKYLFAVNFEIGSTETCHYTGEKLEITDAFLEQIENRLLGTKVERYKRLTFREETQKQYTTQTLTQEIMLEGKPLTETKLFQTLHERYVHNLKENVLAPLLENENFRRAIKDYDTDLFKTYDKRIQSDVAFLMNNLCEKYRYTKQGTKEVCIYVIDSDLAKKFEK